MSAFTGYRWPRAAALTAVVIVVLCGLYWSTIASMAGVWMESDTFSHGFLVFPAVGWLIYRSRERLLDIAPGPSVIGLLALVLCLVFWFVSRVGAVQVAEQFAFVAALGACVWTLLGTAVVRVLAFPLLFAFFAVPFGDFVIPTLMRFTAWFVVEAVELSGIPVYREGYMLSIPRGDFEVAKACSGIRYLIASVSLGTFFAYLTYRTLGRRLVFVAMAILLPILANGLRAYGIVMIAHFTNMQHAVGVDHLIYGWLFFGVLMFILFWVGGRYAQYDDAQAPRSRRTGQSVAAAMSLVPALALAAIVSTPFLSQRAQAAVDQPLSAAQLPAPAGGWRKQSSTARDYVPSFNDANDLKRAVYHNAQGAVSVTIHTYTGGDKELIRAGNTFIGTKGHKIMRDLPVALAVGDEQWEIGRVDMLEAGPRRTILYWYQIGDVISTSPNVAKAREWLARLSGQPTRRALVSMSAPMLEPDVVPDVLVKFVDEYGRALLACVDQPQTPGCDE
ncbi:MAG: exosortase A [Gammaproteobacteria bacterium]